MEAAFLKSAADPRELPEANLPRIAFVGRSNVGKSSLINSLVGRKNLARTSSSPGRTRLINYFSVGARWIFVDLPGYGFARISKEERRRLGAMAEGYLKGDQNLKRLLLLVDARHEPSRMDQNMRDWLEAHQIPFLVVATKADKLSSNGLARSLARIRKTLQVKHVIPYSSQTGAGKKELWRIIQEVET